MKAFAFNYATTSLKGKFLRSAKQLPAHIAFGLLWAGWVSLCVGVHFSLNGWTFSDRLVTALILYATGSFVGGVIARYLSVAVCEHSRSTVRFAFHFVSLAVLTLGFVVLLFVLQHRIYFSQWHAEMFTLTWMFQLFFTGLGSVFLFVLTGLKPLLPWGVLGLLVTSFAFSRGWSLWRR